MDTGRLIHRLLQHLPEVEPALRRSLGRRFLAVAAHRLAPIVVDRMINDALTVIENPAYAALFSRDSRAEVPLAGAITRSDGTRLPIVGQIDRLAVTAREVLIAEYKAGPVSSEEAIPTAFITQLALYHAVVAPLFPGHEVRAFIIWTGGQGAVEIAPATLQRALAPIIHA